MEGVAVRDDGVGKPPEANASLSKHELASKSPSASCERASERAVVDRLIETRTDTYEWDLESSQHSSGSHSHSAAERPSKAEVRRLCLFLACVCCMPRMPPAPLAPPSPTLSDQGRHPTSDASLADPMACSAMERMAKEHALKGGAAHAAHAARKRPISNGLGTDAGGAMAEASAATAAPLASTRACPPPPSATHEALVTNGRDVLISHDEPPSECGEQQLTARAVKFDVPDRPERAERQGSALGGLGTLRSTHGGVAGSAPSLLPRVADDGTGCSTSAPAHPTLLPKGASTRLQRNARPAVMGKGAACVNAESAAPREADADANARPNRRGSVKPDVVPMLNTQQLADAGSSAKANGDGSKAAITSANLQEAVAGNGSGTERLVWRAILKELQTSRTERQLEFEQFKSELASLKRNVKRQSTAIENLSQQLTAIHQLWLSAQHHPPPTSAAHAHGCGSGRAAAPSPPIMIDGRDHKSYGDAVTARPHYSSDELDLFNFDEDELQTARREFTNGSSHSGAAAAASYHA